MSKNQKKSEIELRAFDLGWDWQQSGGKRAAALDMTFLALLKGNKVGDGLPAIAAWNRGWDAANLSA